MNEALISHGASHESFEKCIEKIIERIEARGDLQEATVTQQIEY